MLTGTDSASGGVPEEVRALAEAGIGPYAALLAATGDAARFLGRSDEFGTIAVGLAADLLVVERNPLEDLGALDQPVGVVARGRWLEARALRRLSR